MFARGEEKHRAQLRSATDKARCALVPIALPPDLKAFGVQASRQQENLQPPSPIFRRFQTLRPKFSPSPGLRSLHSHSFSSPFASTKLLGNHLASSAIPSEETRGNLISREPCLVLIVHFEVVRIFDLAGDRSHLFVCLRSRTLQKIRMSATASVIDGEAKQQE